MICVVREKYLYQTVREFLRRYRTVRWLEYAKRVFRPRITYHPSPLGSEVVVARNDEIRMEICTKKF